VPVPVLLAPRFWPAHLLVVAALVAAGWLGLWQYHGWQDRREDAARDLTNAAPLPLADVMGPDDPFPGSAVGQPVEVRGTRVTGSSVTITGRTHHGRDGVWLVDFLDVGGSLLPVVRGWAPSPVTTIEVSPASPTSVTGWLQPSESTGATDSDPSDPSFPQLRIADLAQRFDQDLYGAYVVERDPVGLVQADLDQLPDTGRLTAIRNLLYALEWWVFGGFAAFVWWRWARDTVDAAAGR
jgi:surfeit locus 1 family protein